MPFAMRARVGVIAAVIGCSVIALRFDPAAGSSKLTACFARLNTELRTSPLGRQQRSAPLTGLAEAALR